MPSRDEYAGKVMSASMLRKIAESVFAELLAELCVVGKSFFHQVPKALRMIQFT